MDPWDGKSCTKLWGILICVTLIIGGSLVGGIKRKRMLHIICITGIFEGFFSQAFGQT